MYRITSKGSRVNSIQSNYRPYQNWITWHSHRTVSTEWILWYVQEFTLVATGCITNTNTIIFILCEPSLSLWTIENWSKSCGNCKVCLEHKCSETWLIHSIVFQIANTASVRPTCNKQNLQKTYTFDLNNIELVNGRLPPELEKKFIEFHREIALTDPDHIEQIQRLRSQSSNKWS